MLSSERISELTICSFAHFATVHSAILYSQKISLRSATLKVAIEHLLYLSQLISHHSNSICAYSLIIVIFAILSTIFARNSSAMHMKHLKIIHLVCCNNCRLIVEWHLSVPLLNERQK